jgi:hypothetical protein
VEVAVRATHPCGIAEISIWLGEVITVRIRGTGRQRAAQTRRRSDGTLFGDTWTRDDNLDDTPQEAVSVFPVSALRPRDNCFVVRVVSTCGEAADATTTDRIDGFV